MAKKAYARTEILWPDTEAGRALHAFVVQQAAANLQSVPAYMLGLALEEMQATKEQLCIQQEDK